MAGGELDVEVLLEREVVTYPRLGEKAVTVAITFRHGSLPPLTVWVPKDQDTPQARAQAIRSEILARTQARPKKMRV